MHKIYIREKAAKHKNAKKRCLWKYTITLLCKLRIINLIALLVDNNS